MSDLSVKERAEWYAYWKNEAKDREIERDAAIRERDEARAECDAWEVADGLAETAFRDAEAKLARVEALKEQWRGEPNAGKWCVCADELAAVLKEAK